MKHQARTVNRQMGMVHQVVSGGQTGVDRAALDVAIELGIPHGGWCPRGRLAEDGVIPHRYELREMPSIHYADRTKQNVLDSDATLILYGKSLSGGSALTRRLATEAGRPVLTISLDKEVDWQAVTDWFQQHPIRILNIAGPRASSSPRIYSKAKRFLRRLLQR